LDIYVGWINASFRLSNRVGGEGERSGEWERERVYFEMICEAHQFTDGCAFSKNIAKHRNQMPKTHTHAHNTQRQVEWNVMDIPLIRYFSDHQRSVRSGTVGAETVTHFVYTTVMVIRRAVPWFAIRRAGRRQAMRVAIFGRFRPPTRAPWNLTLPTVVQTAAEDGQHVAIAARRWPLFGMAVQLMVLERTLANAGRRALTTAGSITTIARVNATAAPARLGSGAITPAPAATTLSAFTWRQCRSRLVLATAQPLILPPLFPRWHSGESRARRVRWHFVSIQRVQRLGLMKR
jgi:hypothetical protein